MSGNLPGSVASATSAPFPPLRLEPASCTCEHPSDCPGDPFLCEYARACGKLDQPAPQPEAHDGGR